MEELEEIASGTPKMTAGLVIRINLRHISFSSAAFGERGEIRGKVCEDNLRQSSAFFSFPKGQV